MQRIRCRPNVIAIALVIAASAACQRDSTDSAARQAEHRQILSRLTELEQKVDRLALRPPTAQQPPGPDPARTYQLPVEASPVKGAADAPITIVEFADYQCPFCARSEALVEAVLKAYPSQVRVAYKHFPLTANHPEALPAALAATAAQRQGQFWQMHSLLFANRHALSPEQIEGYARQLGLDMVRFRSDMASDDVKAQVEGDRTLARRVGVRATPTMFVNGRLVRDRTLDGLRQLIDPLLAAAPPSPPPTWRNG
ncbi:MAG: thioredoxin domain-containing protein [Candidatus Binatia bacterium]